jgi:hypothetical protein
LSTPLNINGTIINFPTSAQSPDWSEAIVQFALAVTQALSSVNGPFDVPPTIYTMISNVNTNVPLPSLAFPTSNVRGAVITYTIYRNTTGIGATSGAETGTLELIYNPNGPTGNKWEISDEHTGNANVTFSVTDQGQVTFSSTFISGANATGFIGYTAKSLQQG